MTLKEKLQKLTEAVTSDYSGVAKVMMESMALTTAQYILKHPEEFGLKKDKEVFYENENSEIF